MFLKIYPFAWLVFSVLSLLHVLCHLLTSCCKFEVWAIILLWDAYVDLKCFKKKLFHAFLYLFSSYPRGFLGGALYLGLVLGLLWAAYHVSLFGPCYGWTLNYRYYMIKMVMNACCLILVEMIDFMNCIFDNCLTWL